MSVPSANSIGINSTTHPPPEAVEPIEANQPAGLVQQPTQQPEQQAQPLFSTPINHFTSERNLDGFDTLAELKGAVKVEVKPRTVTCSSDDGSAWMANTFRRHGITTEKAEDILAELVSANRYVGSSWVIKPKGATETSMYKRLVEIFQHVFSIIKYKDSSSRLAVDTSAKYQQHANSKVRSKPDILIIGRDHKFLPPIDGRSLYDRTIVVGDVKVDDSHEGVEEQRAQVAVYAREVFIQQRSRRFVYGYRVTESEFQLMLLDRAGLLESHSFDINIDPTKFVMCVMLLGSPHLELMGFDPSVYWVDGKRFIDVYDLAQETEETGDGKEAGRTKVTYEIVVPGGDSPQGFYQSTSIIGSGLVYWVVKNPALVGAKLLIKDGWRHVKRRAEYEFLQDASDKQIEGVVRLLLRDQPVAVVSTAAWRPDMAKLPQQEDKSLYSEMVFDRIVMEYHPPITHFQSCRQLLEAYRDAIQAHYSLWKEGRILHRNINFYTILLGNPIGAKGQRAFLSDFSAAIRLGREMEESLRGCDIRAINPTYASRYQLFPPVDGPENLHLVLTRHLDARDDIESFYFFLVWIMLSYNRPNDPISANDRSATLQWLEDPARTWKRKEIILNTIEEYDELKVINQYFRQTPAAHRLVVDLGKLVRASSYRREKFPVASEASIRTLYDSFLAAVDLAIGKVTDLPPDTDPTLEQIANQYLADMANEGNVEESSNQWRDRLRPIVRLVKRKGISRKAQGRQISLSPIREEVSLSLDGGKDDGKKEEGSKQAEHALVSSGAVDGQGAKRTRGKGKAPLVRKGREMTATLKAAAVKSNWRKGKEHRNDDKPGQEVPDDEEDSGQGVQVEEQGSSDQLVQDSDLKGFAEDAQGKEESSGEEAKEDKESSGEEANGNKRGISLEDQREEESFFQDDEGDDEEDPFQLVQGDEFGERSYQEVLYEEDDEGDEFDDEEYMDSEPRSLKRKRDIVTKGNVSKKYKFGDD